MTGARIMIVDDDIESLKLIGLMLQRFGYTVLVANSGTMALERAVSQNPDLIILDVMMPDMNGYDVIKQLRSNVETKQIPIIMFTAKTLLEDKVVGFEAGADDYLTKPTHPAELASRIESVLARGHISLSKKEIDELRGKAETNRQAGEPSRVKSRRSTPQKLPSLTVLVARKSVDDLKLKMIGFMLGRQGHRVIEAQSDVETLNKVVSEKPDLIMIDPNISGNDSLETFIREIQNHHNRHIPIIVLVSNPSTADFKAAQAAGAFDYVNLPIKVDTIKVVFERYAKQIYAGFLARLQDADEQIRGGAVIELAGLYKDTPHLFPHTPAQDAFWQNVRHSNQGTPEIADARRKWAIYSDLASVFLLPRPELDEGLIQLAKDAEDTDVLAQALLSIGLNEQVDALDFVLAASHDANKKVRRAAVEALGHMGEVSSIPRLHECLNDSASAICVAAVQSLATIGTERAMQILRENLLGGSVALQSDIVMVLARTDSQSASNILVEAAQTDMHENVLYGITQALAKIDAERAVPVLTNLSMHHSEHVREGAQKALQNFQ